jgi:DNA-binding MarR family transcriptional regulator
MTKRLDDTHLAAWRAFLTAHAALVDGIERDLARAGKIPLGAYDVLLALVEAPNHRLRMRELARTVVLSRSGLTRLVDRLEAQYLLRRERSEDDRRGAYAVLTDEGYAALRATWPVYAGAIVARFARHLSHDDARQLTAILQRLDARTNEV